MAKIIDLTRQRFGELLVLDFYKINKHGNATWRCLCNCGKETLVVGSDLRNGHTSSCGCKEGFRTHGHSRSKIYRVHYNMLNRCYNPEDASFERYGKRGILVCDEWKNDFLSFYNWALSNGYQKGLTIDRIDNDGPYSPENCRFVTMKDNSNNKRNNRWLTYKGKTKTVAQWGELLNITVGTLYDRLYAGWTHEEILTKPPKILNRYD
jgi:hypothetical protein